METTNSIKAIQYQLSLIEQLGTKRLSIMALVEDQLKDIDKDKKEAKDKLKEEFKNIKDITLSLSVANTIVPVIAGASEGDRKRLSRRRSVVISCLQAVYSDYDYEVTKGRSGGKIQAIFMGSPERRQASKLIQANIELCAYLGEIVPNINIDDLEKAIKGNNLVTATNLDDVVAIVEPVNFSAIAEKISALVVVKETAKAKGGKIKVA